VRRSAFLVLLAPLVGAVGGGCGSAPAAPASHPDLASASSIGGAAPTAPSASAASEASAAPEPTVAIDELSVGTGEAAGAGDRVQVHYVGTLADGSVFDSSRKRGQPFNFVLGGGQVIKGWDRGVLGMKVGGHRKLTIPPSLGYGPRGQPPAIPPDSTLVFDIELLAIDHSTAADAAKPRMISARHILIEYMGSRGADAAIVRTREQARTVAKEVLERVNAGEDFARLAVEFSDEAGAGGRGGALGRFGRGKMVPEFDAAAFSLKPGEVSGIVETPFGFHIIQRLE